MQGDGIPHVDVRFPLADDQVGAEGGDRQESPPDAECLKNRYTRHPFILDGQVDELRSDKCQSEHGWKSQVRSEAEHFTENRLLAVAVVCNLCQNRLCYTVDGTAYQGSAHRVPLVLAWV